MAKCITTDIFVNKANLIHSNKYDYSLVEYKNSHTKVKIICKEHGEFEQIANNHLNGKGCPYCKKIKISQYRSSNLEQFLLKANMMHNTKYDYSLSIYNGDKIKIKIICKKHGIFEQTPDKHLEGQGCPLCKSSKGEMKILNFLISNKINFKTQKKFTTCKFKRCLPFDFYLPDYNTCIEYDGEQHFKPLVFGSTILSKEDHLIQIKHNDKIKTKFCNDMNINLIRISYIEFKNIEQILTNKIGDNNYE